MVKTRLHVWSTIHTRKHSITTEPIPTEELPKKGHKEINIKTTHISELYTDDTGRFPVISRACNQYIMMEYHCDANAIMVVTFKSLKDKDRMVACNNIMQHLKDRNMLVHLQILDNEASKEYKTITKVVPSQIHQQNASER